MNRFLDPCSSLGRARQDLLWAKLLATLGASLIAAAFCQIPFGAKDETFAASLDAQLALAALALSASFLCEVRAWIRVGLNGRMMASVTSGLILGFLGMTILPLAIMSLGLPFAHHITLDTFRHCFVYPGCVMAPVPLLVGLVVRLRRASRLLVATS